MYLQIKYVLVVLIFIVFVKFVKFCRDRMRNTSSFTSNRIKDAVKVDNLLMTHSKQIELALKFKNEADEAYNKNNGEKALYFYGLSSKAGNIEALFKIAEIYRFGVGSHEDYQNLRNSAKTYQMIAQFGNEHQKAKAEQILEEILDQNFSGDDNPDNLQNGATEQNISRKMIQSKTNGNNKRDNKQTLDQSKSRLKYKKRKKNVSFIDDDTNGNTVMQSRIQPSKTNNQLSRNSFAHNENSDVHLGFATNNIPLDELQADIADLREMLQHQNRMPAVNVPDHELVDPNLRNATVWRIPQMDEHNIHNNLPLTQGNREELEIPTQNEIRLAPGMLVRDDKQNVHDSVLLRSVKNNIESLRKKIQSDQNTHGTEPVSKHDTIFEFRNMLARNNKIQALNALDAMERNTIPLSALQTTEIDVLYLVLQRINSPANVDKKDDLINTLFQQLDDSIDENGNPVCATGRVTRVLQTLETIDTDNIVSIKADWVIQREILDVSSKLYIDLYEQSTGDVKHACSEDPDTATPASKQLFYQFKQQYEQKLFEKFKVDYVDTKILTQKVVDAKVHEIVSEI